MLDRAGATIASVVLHDIKSKVLVMYKSKLRRELKKTNISIMTQDRIPKIEIFFFDGREDKTLIIKKRKWKCFRKQLKAYYNF